MSDMTLRQLLVSVDAEKYKNHPLFQQLLSVRPEFGTVRRIAVRQQDGYLSVTNVHLGSLGDIVSYPIDVEDGICISNDDLLCAILGELSRNGFSDTDNTDFWNGMTDLQKAKLLR